MIYERQKELNLKIPKYVAILGVGGVGSWVSLFLALVGVKKLLLVDPDVIEDSNLNRTPFRMDQVGEAKVMAAAELIYERRQDVEVLPVVSRENDFVLNELKKVDVIVDCRDGEIFFDNPEIQDKVIAKLGYDGVSITIVPHPKRPSWGEDIVRYTIIPSYLVPPVVLAATVVDMIVRNWNFKQTVTFDGLEEVFGVEREKE